MVDNPPRVALAERDPVLDLFACLVDPSIRQARRSWLREYLAPSVFADAGKLGDFASDHGVPEHRVGYVGHDDLSGCHTLITESVDVDSNLTRSLPELRQVIQFGRFEPRRYRPAGDDIRFVEFERASIRSVGEHAVGLALALLRDLVEVFHETRERDPVRSPSDYAYNWLDTEPRLLADSTVTILGFGQVGQAIARSLGGLRPAEVVYWSRRPVQPSSCDALRYEHDLQDALRAADVAVIALPLTSVTRGLIAEAELLALGRNGLLVNVARGPIISQDALVSALTDGAIGGAALDVFDDEPLPTGHPLRTCPRVLLTPHMAGGSRSRLLLELREVALIAQDAPSV